MQTRLRHLIHITFPIAVGVFCGSAIALSAVQHEDSCCMGGVTADGRSIPNWRYCYHLAVVAPAPPAGQGPLITTTSLPNATAGVAYTATLKAMSGVSPLHWDIPSGSLPVGLGLGSSTGVISGTRTIVGPAASPYALRMPTLTRRHAH